MPEPGPEPTVIVVSPRGRPAPPDVQDAVAQAVKVAFGLLSVGLSVALRSAGETQVAPGQRRPPTPVMDAADVLVGTAWGAARLSGRVAVTGVRVARPLVAFAARPPLVPRRFQPGHGVQVMVTRWQRDRPDTVVALDSWTSTILPGAVEAALNQVDVERLVTLALERIDLDAVVTSVLRRLDIEAVTLAVLQRLDLTRVASTAIESMDLDQVVGEALAGMDMDQLVAGVVNRLDVDAVATAALEQLDLTEIVLKQVDLIRVAEYVVQAIDLPEIIRESTGTVASEAVRGLRMQGVDADVAVARIADRLLHRRRRKTSDQLIPPQAEPPGAEGPTAEAPAVGAPPTEPAREPQP
jgi:hypothetical protein